MPKLIICIVFGFGTSLYIYQPVIDDAKAKRKKMDAEDKAQFSI